MSTFRLRPEDLEWRQVDEDVVVLDLKSGNYLTFNATGGLLFLRLADGATKAELVETILDVYETTEDQAGADVEAFISHLQDEKLLAE